MKTKLNKLKFKKNTVLLILMLAFITSCDFEYELPLENSIEDLTPPKASFSLTQGEGDEEGIWKTYNFPNLSSSATEYLWDFGDGNSSTSIDGLNTYPGEGTFTVTLTAKDAKGITSTSSQTFNIVEPAAPAAITPQIVNGDFDAGQDDWKIAEFTGGTTSPFNSSSDGSFTNYDGTDNGSKTAGAKWTMGTSAGEWVSASTRYAYQAIELSPNTEYILEYEYAIKDDNAVDPVGGRRIVGEILDGHFSDGVDAVASSANGALVSFVGTEANGKTSHTLVKAQFTSNATGQVAIWIYGVTPKDAYVDNVKVYPVEL